MLAESPLSIYLPLWQVMLRCVALSNLIHVIGVLSSYRVGEGFFIGRIRSVRSVWMAVVGREANYG